MVTSFFFVGLGAVFFYLLVMKDTPAAQRQKFKVPFICYCLTIFIAAAFAPIRTLMKEVRGMQVVEYWATGLQWLVIGVCVLLLGKVFFDESSSEK